MVRSAPDDPLDVGHFQLVDHDTPSDIKLIPHLPSQSQSLVVPCLIHETLS